MTVRENITYQEIMTVRENITYWEIMTVRENITYRETRRDKQKRWKPEQNIRGRKAGFEPVT